MDIMNNFDEQKAFQRIDKNIKKMINKNIFDFFAYYVSEIKAINDIKTVLDWTDKKQVFVDFYYKDGSKYFIDSQAIQVCTKPKFEIQLYSLLHECGHYLIDESASRNPKTYVRKHRNGYLSKNKNENSLEYKVSILGEEYEAWNRGYSLAQRLGIKINDISFEKDKNKALRTYIKWAAK